MAASCFFLRVYAQHRSHNQDIEKPDPVVTNNYTRNLATFETLARGPKQKASFEKIWN